MLHIFIPVLFFLNPNFTVKYLNEHYAYNIESCLELAEKEARKYKATSFYCIETLVVK